MTVEEILSGFDIDELEKETKKSRFQIQVEIEAMSDTDRAKLENISQMSQYHMCELWRFSPPGNPYFDSNLPFFPFFKNRLYTVHGGFTPEISKSIGWGSK